MKMRALAGKNLANLQSDPNSGSRALLPTGQQPVVLLAQKLQIDLEMIFEQWQNC